MYYLHASSAVTSFQGEEDELHLGDELFATGMWLFAAGTALLLLDLRYTVVTVSRARQVEVVGLRRDRPLQVLALYLLCLIIFGIASTLYILPDETSQTVGVALYVVSNVSFTAINMVALYYLWMEHSETWAAEAAGAAAGDGEGGEGDGEDAQPLRSVPEEGGGPSPPLGGLVELASVDVSSAAPEEASPAAASGRASGGGGWGPWSSSPRLRDSLEETGSPRHGRNEAQHRSPHNHLTSLTAMLLHNMEARQHGLPVHHSLPRERETPSPLAPVGEAPPTERMQRSRSLDDTASRQQF